MAGENNENEENLQDVLNSPDRELMDFSFFDNLPTPPPPSPNLEFNENYQILQEIELPDPINDFSLDDDLTLAFLFGPLSDVVNDNNVQGEIGDANNVGESNRLEDSMILETGGPGPSTIPALEENGTGNNVGETNTRLEVSTRVFGENRMIYETGGPSTTPVPITPTITDKIQLCLCRRCNKLRILVHTNGTDKMILEIYGGNGFFCNAVLEILLSGEIQHQTINLRDLEVEAAQQYIEDYCMARLASGFELATDANAPFYQGMDAVSSPNQSIEPTIPPPGDDIPIPPVPPSDGVRDEVQPTRERRPRLQTPLALQRERIGNMTLEDLKEYFNVPLKEAARKMKVSATVVKKICRQGRLYRWPNRNISSLERRISSLKSVLRTTKNSTIRAYAEAEIQRLQNEIDAIYNEILENAK